MKTWAEVCPDKLRGGFYTPPRLVQACLNRLRELNGHGDSMSVLEPSVGDGAFLRGLAAHEIGATVSNLVGIELIQGEAEKCIDLADNLPFTTTIVMGSALEWASQTNDQFDIVVGNPPFVRYQFISPTDLRHAKTVGDRLQLSFRGVSNLWIPVLLGALGRLRLGGSTAMVVPSELFTGLSAGVARAWLLSNMTELRIELFEPGAFPGVLQQVVVISGRKIPSRSRQSHPDATVEFVEHCRNGTTQRWSHTVPLGKGNWSKYLLTSAHLQALAEARNVHGVRPLGMIARLEVSIVTGANDFFSVTSEEAESFNLQRWLVPLLPRIRHSPGIIFTDADQQGTYISGAKAWLLDFSHDKPDPTSFPGASAYLTSGKGRGLDLRYKTRIRSPWYRVPGVRPGTLMLSKRSHTYPKLVLNRAGAVTTDTIYRGHMISGYAGRELDLLASFHNSLTMLSAELEGRSFGGGVLELVPSEVGRLSIPLLNETGDEAFALDGIARRTAGSVDASEALVEETDKLIQKGIPGLNSSLMERLAAARHLLVERRLARN